MKQHKRNVEGMHKAMQKKRSSAINRVTKVLEEMTNHNETMTYTQVAKLSRVSKAWLYRQPDIRSRIDELRFRELPPNISKEQALEKRHGQLVILKNRIKKLEKENTELHKQLEIAYGELHLVHKKCRCNSN